ncbi:NADPH-dependent FMN reductase [Haoranjiania flava]|uniref:NAD(P)H-dependent oxidoreductase n=1 Tax=Haoranjiania flava TaxID=1856322 RepID=A0AAE3LL32_9BACT|nr:NAD(P)H-dependent oxidoreductase [Haoranjiania flava]MCU7694934.1 NAD(P)H-dependent oxidoreductase [Haoranjiania flava]
MRKIVAFAGSNSKKSINRKLIDYVVKNVEGYETEVLDLNDYEMPIFSLEREQELGKHELAQKFIDRLSTADIIIASLAEYNGSYTSAFKNVLDWCSRIKKEVFAHKPMLLMCATTSAGGGKSVLDAAKLRFTIMSADIQEVFSLPSYKLTFDEVADEISDETKKKELMKIIEKVFG